MLLKINEPVRIWKKQTGRTEATHGAAPSSRCVRGVAVGTSYFLCLWSLQLWTANTSVKQHHLEDRKWGPREVGGDLLKVIQLGSGRATSKPRFTNIPGFDASPLLTPTWKHRAPNGRISLCPVSPRSGGCPGCLASSEGQPCQVSLLLPPSGS